MSSKPIVSRISEFLPSFWPKTGCKAVPKAPDLHTAWQNPAQLPGFVQQSALAQRYLDLLGPLNWTAFPERDLARNYGQGTVPLASFACAGLIKLNEGQRSWYQCRRFLVEHPTLVWLLGFPVVGSSDFACGFDPEASLPTVRYFTEMLRKLDNQVLQFLLTETIQTIQAELAALQAPLALAHPFGEAISLDTKHILAWVKENNPKAYVTNRYNKAKQPKGDPDCRLGVKRRRNQKAAAADEGPPTPQASPVPGDSVSLAELYWGYASGVVATKVPGWGEFVLAEFTQPFNCGDTTYFFPLMAQTEARLGQKPRFGALDAAFDAYYVYEYFLSEDGQPGFAAVPFSKRNPLPTFNDKGLPVCEAGLPMPLKGTFWSKATFVEHERGRYACPLRHPQPTGETCPIQHKKWPKGGCLVTMPTSLGARIRHQLDRHSDAYKRVYNQRTATERINAQAKALGIERPNLRNRAAITNQNTLIYILINLRALARLRAHKNA